MLTVDTPLGTLRASESDDDHPGIWIEFQRLGEEGFSPLILVEHTDGKDENLTSEAILTRVWKDPEEEDVIVIVHENTTVQEEQDSNA